jgi:single-strand DNA-binding protein
MSVVNIMAGRLTGDPESKTTQSGNTMANFSIADNHGKDAQGQDKVTFFRCSAFGKQAEMILASCKKGHRLNVVGRLETHQYTNNSGQQVTSLDVTVSEFGFIEPRQEQPMAAPQAQPQYQPPGPAPAPAAVPQYTTDAAGNTYQLINNQWVMVRPAGAPPQPHAGYQAPQPPQLPFGNPPPPPAGAQANRPY